MELRQYIFVHDPHLTAERAVIPPPRRRGSAHGFALRPMPSVERKSGVPVPFCRGTPPFLLFGGSSRRAPFSACAPCLLGQFPFSCRFFRRMYAFPARNRRIFRKPRRICFLCRARDGAHILIRGRHPTDRHRDLSPLPDALRYAPHFCHGRRGCCFCRMLCGMPCFCRRRRAVPVLRAALPGMRCHPAVTGSSVYRVPATPLFTLRYDHARL